MRIAFHGLVCQKHDGRFMQPRRFRLVVLAHQRGLIGIAQLREPQGAERGVLRPPLGQIVQQSRAPDQVPVETVTLSIDGITQAQSLI